MAGSERALKVLKTDLGTYYKADSDDEVTGLVRNIGDQFEFLYGCLLKDSLLKKQCVNGKVETQEDFVNRILAYGENLERLIVELLAYHSSDRSNHSGVIKSLNKCYNVELPFDVSVGEEENSVAYVKRILNNASYYDANLTYENNNFNFKVLIAIGLAVAGAALLVCAITAGVIGTMALVSGTGPLLLLAGAVIAGFILTIHALGIASVASGAVLGAAGVVAATLGVAGFLKTKGLFPFDGKLMKSSACDASDPVLGSGSDADLNY